MVLALVLGRVVEKRESDEEEKKVAGERETTTIAAVALQDKYNRGRAENWERKRRKSTRRRGGGRGGGGGQGHRAQDQYKLLVESCVVISRSFSLHLPVTRERRAHHDDDDRVVVDMSMSRLKCQRSAVYATLNRSWRPSLSFLFTHFSRWKRCARSINTKDNHQSRQRRRRRRSAWSQLNCNWIRGRRRRSGVVRFKMATVDYTSRQ